MFKRITTVLLGTLALNGPVWADLNTGLVAYYPLDESVGATVAYDAVGYIDGSVQGDTRFAPGMGIRGGAAKFDTLTDSYITMGNNFGFTDSSFSIQAWVKLDSRNGGFLDSAPVAKHRGTVAGYFLTVGNQGDGCGEPGKTNFYVAYPCSGFSTIAVDDGLWHQIVGVYDQTRQVSSVYVDGQLQTASPGGNPNTPTDAPFAIAGMMSGITGEMLGVYKGWVDEVKLYNRILNPAEINALYLQTPQKTFASFAPVLHLAMNPSIKDDNFTLSGTFSLDAASDGVDPIKETVTLQVGDYVATIPAGGFNYKNGKYNYQKILPESTLNITITPASDWTNYSFIAKAKSTDFTRKALPMRIELSIGGEGAATRLFTDTLTAKP